MRFLFHLLLLSIFFIQPNHCFSQVDKSDYNLLWEIKGNGLEKSSYLFGTIHLKDKRAFEFSDSLLYKLQECEALATEVHPDSAFLFYSNIFLRRDTTDFLKKMLSPEAYERLKKQLKDEKDISLDSLKSKNPFAIESLFSRKPPERVDDKDLFVDYYLYRMARRSGKLTFGLEKMEDHRNMVDLFFQNFEEEPTFDFHPINIDIHSRESKLETLLKTYQTGSLEKIQTLLNKYPRDEAYENAALTQRNIIMAENIQKIIQQHTLFATMGTAHLPGDDGVIALLQKAGYTLRPVSATFTGKAEKFEIEAEDALWNNYQEAYHKFKIDFPGKPFVWDYEKVGKELFDHYAFYNDILEKNKYFIKVQANYKSKETALDSFLLYHIKSAALRTFEEMQIDTKKITLNGMEGLEFQAQTDSLNYVRGQALYSGSAIYFAVATRQDDQLDHPDIQRFFNSFDVDQPETYAWKRFKSDEGAFSISTPYPPNETQMEIQAPDEEGTIHDMVLNVFTVKDYENGYLFLMRYNGMGEGTYFDNDSALLDVAVLDFVEKQGEPDTVFTISKEGFNGRELHFIKDNVFLRIQLYLRGARFYLLIGTNLESAQNDDTIDDYFNSFQFESFEDTPFSKFDLEKGKYSANFPKKPIQQSDSSSYNYPLENFNTFAAQDPNSSINYFLIKSSYSPYFQVDTIENYLDKLIDESLESSDSIIYTKVITNNGHLGKYVKIESNLTHNIEHSYTMLKGAELYELYIFAPKDFEEEKVLSFINSLKFTDPTPVGNLTSRKIESIMEGFYSTDSLTSANAKQALVNHPFVASELPFIYQALEKEYPGDTLLYYSTISTLCDLLVETNDSNTVAQLVSNYHKFPKNEIRRLNLLNTLGQIKTAESLNAFLPLFKNYQQKEDLNNYLLFSPFRDSLEFLLENYDIVISKFQQDSTWNNQIPDLILNLVNTDSVDFSIVNRDAPIFIKKIKALVEKEKLMSKDSIGYFDTSWELSNYIKIVRKLELQKSDIQYLKSLLSIKNASISANVVRTLVNLGQKISKKQWKYIAKAPIQKFYLTANLHSDSLLSKNPKKWLNKKDLALSSFYARYQDDGYYYLKFEDLKIINSFPFQYGKKDYQVHVVQFTVPDEEGKFIGLTSNLVGKNKYDFYPPIFDFGYEAVEDKDVDTTVDNFLDWYKKDDLRKEKENTDQ